MNAFSKAMRYVGALGWCLGLAGMVGCATTFTFGTMPKVEAVPSLKVGTAKAAEVLAALGEPRGRGRARFGADFPEQQVWFYEYMQTDGRKAQLKMLMVFMDNETYAGHMWFSSGQLVGVTK